MRSFLSSGFGRGEREGDEGMRERAGDMSQKRGGNAAKMKFASGAVTTDYPRYISLLISWRDYSTDAVARQRGQR